MKPFIALLIKGTGRPIYVFTLFIGNFVPTCVWYTIRYVLIPKYFILHVPPGNTMLSCSFLTCLFNFPPLVPHIYYRLDLDIAHCNFPIIFSLLQIWCPFMPGTLIRTETEGHIIEKNLLMSCPHRYGYLWNTLALKGRYTHTQGKAGKNITKHAFLSSPHRFVYFPSLSHTVVLLKFAEQNLIYSFLSSPHRFVYFPSLCNTVVSLKFAEKI